MKRKENDNVVVCLCGTVDSFQKLWFAFKVQYCKKKKSDCKPIRYFSCTQFIFIVSIVVCSFNSTSCIDSLFVLLSIRLLWSLIRFLVLVLVCVPLWTTVKERQKLRRHHARRPSCKVEIFSEHSIKIKSEEKRAENLNLSYGPKNLSKYCTPAPSLSCIIPHGHSQDMKTSRNPLREGTTRPTFTLFDI